MAGLGLRSGCAQHPVWVSFPAEMGRPRLERLTADDERILSLEHGSVAGHWCKVVMVDGALGAARVRQAVGARLALAPRLRQRLEMLPRGFGRPVWAADPDFVLGRHVRAADVSAPLDDGALQRYCAAAMQERLDRTRPLWRLDVVPLTGERTALVWCVHHCMADGFTAMRIGGSCIWTEASGDADSARSAGRTAPPARSSAPSPFTPRTALLAAAALDRCAAGVRELRTLGRDLAATRHWSQGVMHLRAITASARRELAPSPVVSYFDAPLGRRRAVAWTSVPLRALHDAAKRAGGGATLNDAVVALIASGVATWAAQQDRRAVPAVRIRIPVSLHGTNPAAGNRDSFIDVDVPLHGSGVIERLRAVNRETAAAKSAHDADNVDRVLHAMAALPWGSHLVALADSPHEFGLCISNVVGPRAGAAVDGVPVSALHAIVEVAQHHDLRASVISCGDRLSLCLCADADRIDPAAVMQGVESAWAELRDALPVAP